VAEVNDEIRQLVDDMLETMYDAPGIGLAAIQVNAHKRVLVTDISEEGNEPLVFINPKILVADGIEVTQEGCLSVPGFYEEVERAEHIVVEALDRDGKRFKLECHELQAVCIQHEIDHLDGKLFVDYISPLKRNRIQRKLEKLKKQGALNKTA
jgi:peptide deformylase